MRVNKTLPTYSDQAVLEAVRKGNDDRELSYLYRVLYPKVKRLIIGNNGGEEDAKDIFQNALIIFHKHVKEGKFKEEHEIAGFIYTVSKYLWIKQVKKYQKSPEIRDILSDVTDASDIETTVISSEKEEFIMKIFAELGNPCEKLLIYSIYGGYSSKEIAEKMGFANENVAKSKKYQCRKKLEELVKNNLEYLNFFKDR